MPAESEHAGSEKERARKEGAGRTMESGGRAEQEDEQEQQSGADATHPGPRRYSIARAADLEAPGSGGSVGSGGGDRWGRH